VCLVWLVWPRSSHDVTEPHAIKRVTPLHGAEERRAIAAQIAQHTALHAAGQVPSLPAAVDPNVITSELHDELHQVQGFLRACYETALPALVDVHVRVEIDLTLTSDLDVGTLIEADVLLDPHTPRLPPPFVQCLRSTLQMLELPPLVGGDRITVTYPFAFDP
jgi:hypothetical protein